MDEPNAEKEFAPTERRLDEARRKGEVPIGRDLLAAAAFAGLVLAAVAAPDSLIRLGQSGTVLLDQADRLAPLFASGGPSPAGALGAALLFAVLPWFALPALAVLAMLIAQRALVFATARLEPKLSRISLLQGAKRKFGRAGLFEFGKSFAKLLAVSGILAGYLSARAAAILHSLYLEPPQVTALMVRLLVEFLLLVTVLQALIGGLDLLWQRHEHLRQHRMSRKDMTDEMKQSEGDPHVKAQRRQRAMEIASNQMLADVPKADVVIVNPTHYAVALKWNRQSSGAPVCVAKGVDTVAARIRETAAAAGVPIRSDAPTARALYASVDLGQEIRPEHYRTVAAAIRFAEAMRRRAHARRGAGDQT
ncbi:flagellar biosynthetic protein FlhB [Gemmobacter megaterium]|uniref:Flagellar biosynthetic protein FlhB n=1 Tax=Gemmobacter megaterium TaxID=1086013 RepID=A0A1N7LW82_9RHOB|nr:flagellar type III secretion system protein FlhB [Gemmobacter megaterium]GGE10300.1 flagellar biosynthesis protein FlhB [Gemmobacter megaterium]SIS78086.1 flagellar biosynthetic protein FlhB [Gemmobacter megaterium]